MLMVMLCSTFGVFAGLALTSPSEAAFQCTDDLQGADDQPGQKDLTRMCRGLATDIASCSGVDAFSIRWNWDDTGFSGNNTGDACALFDTDGDGNANFALCVTVTGDPATQAAQSPRLYSCADDRPDRCTNALLIQSLASTCSISTAADPFGGNHQCHGTDCDATDTAASCCIQPSDVGGGTAVLTDVCSFPSQQPNSDPSDCIIHVTRECTVDADCDDGHACTVDTCNASGSCVHTAAASGTVCRAAAGLCDLDETCNGTDVDCPADAKVPAGTICAAASDVCENDSICDGSTDTCAPKTFKPDTTVCHASTGVCDPEETCTGSSAACPTDVKLGAGTVCNAASGVCENDGVCDGTTGACGPKSFKPDTTVCHASTGVCDPEEACTGSSADCPADQKLPAGTICAAAGGVCENPGVCDGTTGTCGSKTFKPDTTVCRAKNGACDVAETCTGSSAACPDDAFVTGTVCRAASGLCDIEEVCNGSGPNCPANTFAPAGTLCRAGDGICDPDEVCTGTSGTCPGDVIFDPTLITCQERQVLVCRTAGFWGTHAGTEKKNSQNITGKVIDAANGALGDNVGEIVICGEHLVNTAVNDAASAVEALCVSVKGDSRLQLARQLTAAALNCAISGGASDCSTVPAYDAVFEACNAACAANTTAAFGSCIAELDCLNNGGLFDAATGFCQTGHCSDNDAPCNDGNRSQCASSTATCVPLVGTCHDQPLCPVGFPGLCFDETGPAGSSIACNSANGTACTIVGSGEAKCAVDSATIK